MRNEKVLTCHLSPITYRLGSYLFFLFDARAKTRFDFQKILFGLFLTSKTPKEARIPYFSDQKYQYPNNLTRASMMVISTEKASFPEVFQNTLYLFSCDTSHAVSKAFSFLTSATNWTPCPLYENDTEGNPVSVARA